MGIFDGLADTFTGVFGQPVTIAWSLLGTREIQAIFVRRTVDDLGIIQSAPMLHARSADLEGVADADKIYVGETAYVAREVRPDGRGMTTVVLEAANG